MSDVDDLIARQRDEYTCTDELHAALADALESEHTARLAAEAEP